MASPALNTPPAQPTPALAAFTGDGPLPSGRTFYGATRSSEPVRDLTLSEIVHTIERSVPVHTHERAYFELALGGNYEESCYRGMLQFRPFTSAYNPTGTRHFGRVGPGGVRLFSIEVGDVWLQQFRLAHTEPGEIQDSHGGEMTFLALQLLRQHLEGEAPALTVESLVWELIAAAAQVKDQRLREAPAWWSRILELLHADFAHDLSIAEVAAEARVHPVHLARTFRRLLNQTPGEYVQRLRVRYACEQLSQPDCDIAEVAAASGFSDQSHLTRVFKRFSHTTPAEFHNLIAHPRKALLSHTRALALV